MTNRTKESWDLPGKVEIANRSKYTTVTVTGNVHSDLPSQDLARIREALRWDKVPDRLLLDLTDVHRIDSWAEDHIADLVGDVAADRGRIAVVSDPARPAQLIGLRVLLKEDEKEDRVRFLSDRSLAEAWLVS